MGGQLALQSSACSRRSSSAPLSILVFKSDASFHQLTQMSGCRCPSFQGPNTVQHALATAPLFSVRKHFFIWALPCGLPPMYCCPACKKSGWQSSYWRVFHICAESLDPLDVHERKRLSRVATTHPLRRPRVGRICHAIQNVTAILVFMLILVRAP